MANEINTGLSNGSFNFDNLNYGHNNEFNWSSGNNGTINITTSDYTKTTPNEINTGLLGSSNNNEVNGQVDTTLNEASIFDDTEASSQTGATSSPAATQPAEEPQTETPPVEEPKKEEPKKEEPKEEKKEEQKEEKKSNTNNKHFDIPLSNSEQDIVYECAEKYGLDPAVVFGVIERESSFNKNIGINSSNCAGLMQLNLSYSAKYGVTADNYDDVYTNINGGCMLLGQYYKKYGNYHQALMAYNYGENGARNHWNRGEYSSGYSRDVMRYAEKYR